MNIIIVGDSGFVSGTLARVAVAAGHRVRAVTSGKRPMVEGVTPIRADRTDRDGFAGAVAALDQRFDLTVDCIGDDADDVRQDVRVFRDRASLLGSG